MPRRPRIHLDGVPLHIVQRGHSREACFLALANTPKQRQPVYRTLFRSQLDQEAISDIRLALNQNQPLGNARFMSRIAKLMGERREARPRGRPRLVNDGGSGGAPG